MAASNTHRILTDPAPSPVPVLTRLVRASALLAAQAAAVGFGINTVRQWSRLPEFVTSNRVAATERNGMLLWLVMPVLIWVAVAYVEAIWHFGDSRRLVTLERKAQRWSWVMAVGALPVLLHPSLWRTRTLMFLLTAGTVSLLAWWSIRLTQQGWQRGHEPRGESDFARLADYLSRLAPPQLKVVAPLFILGVGVLYAVLHGVWTDPTVVPRTAFDPPVSIHSLRQAFQLLGHGGWLGIPIVALKFLRPPGHAHVFFWAVCVTSAAFPLYAWARHHLGIGIALVIALCYLAMPMLRTVGRAEVIPLGVAAGLFFLATLQWERRRYGLALLATVLTLGIHEQAAWWFFCVGIYFAAKVETASLGRWLAIGSGVYFLVVAGLLLPHFGLEPYRDSFRGLWDSRPVGLLETVKVSLVNPPYVLSRWLELQGLAFWLALFVPFAFLPVVGSNWLLWAMPGIVFVIVAAGRPPGLPPTSGAVAHFVVLGFAASIANLSQLARRGPTRARALAAIIAWVFVLVPCLLQLGGLWLPAL